MRDRSTIPALMCTLLTVAAACSDTSPKWSFEPGGAALLVVAPSAAILRGGARLQLNLSAHDEQGQPAEPAGVIWTSSNPNVAEVAADGVVTGHETGASRITAWWNGTRGNSMVSVVGDAPGSQPCQTDGGHPQLSLKTICLSR